MQSRLSPIAGFSIVAVLLLTTGCTVLGAGAGAAMGAMADPRHPARGAFVGATAGAMTGWVFDEFLLNAHHRHHRHAVYERHPRRCR